MLKKKLTLRCKVHTRKIYEKIHFDPISKLIHIHVIDQPQKGKANAAIIALLSKTLDIPQYYITIKNGFTTTIKTIEIQTTKTFDSIIVLLESVY